MDELRQRPRLRLGPYELGERLGMGGMAEVYVARRAGPRGFTKRFAVKRILPQLAQDPHFVSMFCDEARIAAALSHPNIVQVVDFGEHDGELFMAMEFVDGVSCAKLLRFVSARGERFPLAATLFIAHEVLRGLSYAHEARDEQGQPLGIVHRDVSPGNVLIGRAGDVKLTDFGIVRSAMVDRRTNPGELKGKIGYMSPEQAMGSEVDARSDIFAVGIIIAEMLLARPLFPGRNELEILSRIHDADLGVLERHGACLRPELLDALRRAMAKKPAERFASAVEFADALRAVARSAGATLSDTDLVPWLSSLGVLPCQSGTRPVVAPEDRAELLARLARTPSAAPRARVATGPLLPREGGEYRLRLRDGGAVGPLAVTDLVELAATGRVGPRTLVAERTKTAPLVAVPGLARVLRRPAYGFWTPLGGRQALLRRSSLPSALYSLTAGRATGLLVARGERREKRVFLRDGAPVFVTSTSRSELLGRRLVERGAFSAEELEQALRASLASGEPLGALLIQQRLIRPPGLFRALFEQLEDRVVELGSWEHGELGFEPGVIAPDEAIPLVRSPVELVTRLIRVGYGDGEIATLLEQVGLAPIAAVPSARLPVAELGLTRAEAWALGRAPGAVSLPELVAGLGDRVSAVDVRRAVFIGLSAGVLAMPGWVGAALA